MKSVKVPALELFLHEMIPLAKAMGVGVEVSDDRVLVLTAPKEQNRNSLNTAFGAQFNVGAGAHIGLDVVLQLLGGGLGRLSRRFQMREQIRHRFHRHLSLHRRAQQDFQHRLPLPI